jgi:hypothetical protein
VACSLSDSSFGLLSGRLRGLLFVRALWLTRSVIHPLDHCRIGWVVHPPCRIGWVVHPPCRVAVPVVKNASPEFPLYRRRFTEYTCAKNGRADGVRRVAGLVLYLSPSRIGWSQCSLLTSAGHDVSIE